MIEIAKIIVRFLSSYGLKFIFLFPILILFFYVPQVSIKNFQIFPFLNEVFQVPSERTLTLRPSFTMPSLVFPPSSLQTFMEKIPKRIDWWCWGYYFWGLLLYEFIVSLKEEPFIYSTCFIHSASWRAVLCRIVLSAWLSLEGDFHSLN